MSESSPRYIYDYMAEMFFLLPGDRKTLHHRYITYYEKLKGYGRGFKSQDFDKFNLKAWAIVPISNSEKLDMSVYLSKNNEIEDFRMQYRAILDRRLLSDPTKEVLLPLKDGYTQRDIHSLHIRTDYGHQNKQGKIKHTNIDLYDVFNNKINVNDEKSFVQQDFNIPQYEWAIHYVLMQVENSIERLKRETEIICVKFGDRFLNEGEEEEVTEKEMHNITRISEFFTRRGYSLLDVLIRCSMEHTRIHTTDYWVHDLTLPLMRYRSLWKIMQKTGLLKNLIRAK